MASRQCPRRAIAVVRQRSLRSSDASPCFGRHVKLLVPAALAVVSTHQPTLDSRGRGRLWLFVARSPYVIIPMKGLCPSSGMIVNRLIIISI
jgi:hypothetical protein